MAQKQYDALLGAKKDTVTPSSGSSISTSAVRVTIDDSNCTSKEAALEALEAIEQVITEGTWPPT